MDNYLLYKFFILFKENTELEETTHSLNPRIQKKKYKSQLETHPLDTNLIWNLEIIKSFEGYITTLKYKKEYDLDSFKSNKIYEIV